MITYKGFNKKHVHRFGFMHRPSPSVVDPAGIFKAAFGVYALGFYIWFLYGEGTYDYTRP